MRCCGFSRHMRSQPACMPVRFGLRNFWSITMVSAILCGRTHGVFKEIWESNLILQTGVCYENAHRNPCNVTGLGQLSSFGSGWLIQTHGNTIRDVMKADISLKNSVASNWWTRQMKDAFGNLHNGAVYRSDFLHYYRELNISNLCVDLRFRHQAVWREAHGQDPCSCLKKSVAYHNLFCFAWETGFWCTCTICLAGVFEDGSEQKCHEERSSVQDSRK